MPTKDGATIIDASVPAATGETILGPYLVESNISIGVDIVIQNGATGPTTPLICVVEWERKAGLGFSGIQFQGGTGANDRIPLMNFKVPFDSEKWRVKYTGADTQAVTLTIKYGKYAP